PGRGGGAGASRGGDRPRTDRRRGNAGRNQGADRDQRPGRRIPDHHARESRRHRGGAAMSRVYWMEAKMELRKMARLKQYSFSIVAFPLMFYIFFGLAMASSF